jgi:hypothetical protein
MKTRMHDLGHASQLYEGLKMERSWFHTCRAKVSETLSQKASEAWWYIPIVPARQEVKVGGSWSETDPWQKAQEPT